MYDNVLPFANYPLSYHVCMNISSTEYSANPPKNAQMTYQFFLG